MFENLEQLIKTIREKKNSSPDKSYTNKLLNDKNLSVSKVKEEIGELIESVEFKIPEKSSYQKHPNPASRYAVVGVYVAKYKKGVNVAVTGAKPNVYNDKDLAKALESNFSSNSMSGMKANSSDMNSDIHASAEYRASLVVTQAKKAVEACK